MSKVYVLTKDVRGVPYVWVGLVTKEEIAAKFGRLEEVNNYRGPFEVDDPELLNRIAKEGEESMKMITKKR